ncbi:MAG: branched-chain amino acid transport system ATP-binding protein [Chloroflexi bacterium]|jgi:branched-chain amino acid transport system ATP-binding protein|nr:MAG: branched-chain amino acid transport system ATP-binding protein [Chloroflexota bacterium]
MKALSAQSVSKVFGGLHAVSGVTIEVEPGECRAIIGPNGAGKTTLLHLLSGTLPVTSGAISLMGQDVTKMRPFSRTLKGLGRTFQITSLFPSLTIEQNVMLALQPWEGRRYAIYRPATSFTSVMNRAQEMLEEGGFWEKRSVPVRQLSHGEQRQLELILALAGRPSVLLLDEPTAGLSEAERTTMTEVFYRLKGEVAMLLVSHDIDVAFAVADSISVLHLGELLVEGPPLEVRADPRVMRVYLGDEVEDA